MNNLTATLKTSAYAFCMRNKFREFYFSSKLKVSLLILSVVTLFAIFLLWPQSPKTPNLPHPPLKDLAAQHGIQMGNFAMTSMLSEKPYVDILTGQFSLALADNTPNWYFTDGGLRPSKDQYNFKQMDEVMAFARQHKMEVQAHHYLWGEEKWLPEWLKEGGYSRNQLMDIIKDHIQTVGAKYSGQIKEWTVVNEAFSRGQHIYGLNDWWADNTGSKEYIDQAFIWARQADPKSKLILNDFNNEGINDISDEMYNYIKSAKSRGIPIDGIGMQMHIDGTHPPTKDEVISNMKRFGELGIEVYVTEFDINMNDLKTEGDDKDQIAGNIYYEMMRACIESGYCHSFSILGITDKETWYNHMGLKDARPLPFDKNYQPKPAFYSLRTALQQ